MVALGQSVLPGEEGHFKGLLFVQSCFPWVYTKKKLSCPSELKESSFPVSLRSIRY